MSNPLLRILIAGTLAMLAIAGIKKGMDWHEADTAPLMYLTVDHLAAADCKGLPQGLAGQPESGDVCRFTGYVYSRSGGCAAGRDAWGVSEQRHGNGAFVAFCLPQPAGAPSNTTHGVIRSYEAVQQVAQ